MIKNINISGDVCIKIAALRDKPENKPSLMGFDELRIIKWRYRVNKA
jgi:hypothetical protein